MTYQPRAEDLIAYTGPDVEEMAFYHGHPGVIDSVVRESNPKGEKFLVVIASFVSGPSLQVPADDLEPLTKEEYLKRGKRLCRNTHPLEELPVVTVGAPGEEWPR